MIKLELPQKPLELTDRLQLELTEVFKQTGKSVWNIAWLKEAVFNMSFGKCCYSDVRLGEESKYMEIEHFKSKDDYPDSVMEWGNLLPSCKKCNGTKNKHDVLAEPLVNPFVDNPKDFFYLKNYRYYPKNNSIKAMRTIEKVALNDRKHFVTPRFNVGNIIGETLEGLYSRVEDTLNPRRKTRFISKFKGLLQEGDRHVEYSALVSTIILSDVNFENIETFFKDNDLWDDELQGLKEELEFCALLEP